MAKYIHQQAGWPSFLWEQDALARPLADVRHRQGRLLGRMEALGFELQSEATLQTLTMDVLKSSEIEGELLNRDQVRSSIARRLGMDVAGLVPSDRNVDGIVEMMVDATRNYNVALTRERLFGWHSALFPTARSGLRKITVGTWRNNPDDDPMQVLSGPMGREKVHFEAPRSGILNSEMKKYLTWFNNEKKLDPATKAAIAHLWFVTLHPFEDGNGRIARAITDMLLAVSDGTRQRFYSMSAQIRKERNDYYSILETTQRGSLDITSWLMWFLGCLDRAFTSTEEILSLVLKKAKFWETHAKTMFNDRQISVLNRLLDGFDGKLSTSKWATMTKCSQDTALRDIQDLIHKDVLKQEPSGGRSTRYFLAD
ncbi:MAG: Fic family protein [Fibrobacterota bacterium]